MKRNSDDKASTPAAVLHPGSSGAPYLKDLFAAEADWPLAPVVAWIVGEGRRMAEPAGFIAELCRRLVEAGAPAWRLGLDVRAIHPQFAAWQLVWTRDTGCVHERRVAHGVRDTVAYVGSPTQRVHETGAEARYRLDRLDPEADHPSLQFLGARGGADYVALPLRFSTGQINVLSVATDRAGGFSDADLAKFAALAEVLALLMEIFATHRTALSLLETYVGRRAGRRVLRGLIRRGDGETIDAAVWMSDLRDFTPLSETLPAKQLLDMLNAYFDFVSAAAAGQGGEILHFTGDACLIVFPISGEGGRRLPCGAALEAARDAFNGIATVNARQSRVGQPKIRFGVGLHVGEVVYGNVGAPDRLAFTVIGPAVNRAARLEGLTKDLDHPVLTSAEFAAAVDEPLQSLGYHTLKGVVEPQEIFVPQGF